jgi:hypothetical protein
MNPSWRARWSVAAEVNVQYTYSLMVRPRDKALLALHCEDAEYARETCLPKPASPCWAKQTFPADAAPPKKLPDFHHRSRVGRDAVVVCGNHRGCRAL